MIRDVLIEFLVIVEGYNFYFSFSCNCSGYFGVVIFCKDNVILVVVEEGLSGLFVI